MVLSLPASDLCEFGLAVSDSGDSLRRNDTVVILTKVAVSHKPETVAKIFINRQDQINARSNNLSDY